MVYLSQLLRKDNFLTIEAIVEIISDKFDGFSYTEKKKTLFFFFCTTKINKTKRWEVKQQIGEIVAVNITAKNLIPRHFGVLYKAYRAPSRCHWTDGQSQE